MASGWTPLLVLAVLFAPLLLLQRWLSQHLQGVGLLFTGNPNAALLLHYVILLPGIILHELSHLLAARLVGVKTGRMSLGPKLRSGGNVRFGAVTVRHSDPLRESWIGLAPLLTGSTAVLLLGRWRLQLPTTLQGGLPAVGQALSSALASPDALLWLYLIFAISNAMMPSESDRRPWASVLLFLALTAALLYVLGLVPQIPAAALQWGQSAVSYLALSFAIAVAVDVPMALLLLVLERVGEGLLNRKVEY